LAPTLPSFSLLLHSVQDGYFASRSKMSVSDYSTTCIPLHRAVSAVANKKRK
jgi:hypothetical protein